MPEVGFGELLRRLRVSAGLTQEGLAERAGISAKAISDLERDPTRRPRLDSVVALSDALELDPDGKTRLLAAARPGTVAAPKAPQPTAALPYAPTPLIGRTGVVRTLVDLVRQRRYRLVTVGGPGGVGKTRVAVEVARELTADFPDGVVAVDLTSAREVPAAESAIATALGVADQGPLSLWEAVVSALGERELLLLLDNLEQVLAVRASIVELLAACPGVSVLATSRIPLQVRDERVYRIAPLELPPSDAAVELFRERAEAAGAQLASDDDSTAAIAAICRRLDGLPLAIELAAVRAALLPPVELLARLQRTLPLLTGGPHDLPTRQQTMRDTIAWSYDLLTPIEQRLFRRLCVFTGGFDHAAAEALADQTGGLLDLLTGLASHNMLRPLSARMTILETIKEYGLEQLDGEGETPEVLGRHARYFADLVVDRADDPRLEDDLDNVRAALSWAVATEHAAIALDIGGALWPFWSRRGQLTEGRRWLDAILRLPEIDTNVELAPARTRVLVGATTLAVDQGAFEAAETWCPRAIEAARRVGSRSDLMLALTAQGLLARHRSRYGEAEAAYEEALALATDLDDVPAAARISVGLSCVASVNGDLDKATGLTERASAAARAVPDPRTRADILQMLAWLAFHRGQPDRVEATGQEALALYRELRESGQIAETLRVVGASASTYGRYRQAEALLAESYALHRDRGDEFRAGLVAAVQAHAALNIDDVAHAAKQADLAVTITRRYQNPWPIAMSLLMAGHVALVMADIHRAVGLLAEAAEVMSVLNSPLYLSWCVEGIIEIAVGRGDWELAARARGVRDALLARTGSQLPPVRPAAFARVLELMPAEAKPTDDPIGDLRQIIAELRPNSPA